MYHRETYDAKPVHYINNLSIEMIIECPSIAVELSKLKYIIICVYRPPQGDVITFFNQLSMALTFACTHADHCVLCGDLNIDYLSTSLPKQLLVDILESFDLNILLREPTRVVRNINCKTTQSAIDYVATNIARDNVNECKLWKGHITDHDKS